jgi:hypothetical protein
MNNGTRTIFEKKARFEKLALRAFAVSFITFVVAGGLFVFLRFAAVAPPDLMAFTQVAVVGLALMLAALAGALEHRHSETIVIEEEYHDTIEELKLIEAEIKLLQEERQQPQTS